MKEPSAKYLAPSRYKQTEVGVIPEDWTLSNLAALSAFITKGSTPTTYGFNWQLEGFLFLRSECVSENGLDLLQSTYISDAAHASLRRSQINDGDLLITITGNVGRVVLFRNSAQANINQHIARVRITASEANRDFVYHFLSLPQCRTRFTSITTGQAYPQISLKQVREAPVPLPPTKAEQEAIAEALSDADALIESMERLLAKKRQIKEGAMQELLTGKKRLAGFGGEWEVKALGELFKFSGGLSASRDQLSTEGHCYLHYGDIHTSNKFFIDVRSEFRDIPKLKVPLNKVSAKALLADGDVVFVDASEDDEGASKHVVVVNPDNRPFISGLHTIVAKSTSTELDHQYRRYCFQTRTVKSQFRFFAVGTKVSGISKTNIAKVTMPVPSVAEQVAIASIFSDMDAEIVVLEGKLIKARSLKQGMMQELLTGRIRLVQSETNVVQLLPKAASVLAPAKSHNWAINEAVVISVLAKNFGSEQWPLGRMRYTKLSYLLHRHVEGQAEGFLKKAAGPYNPATKYKGPEGIALKNGYIQRHSRDQFSGFIAAEKIDEADSYFTKWYGEDVMVWLEQFRLRTNDELELLATVDMAMADLRKAGKAEQLANVKRVIRDHPEWEAKLSRSIFSDDKIVRAMKSCQKLFGSEE